MSILIGDFETKSSVPIDRGLMNYLHTKDSDIFCFTYSIDFGPTDIWIPGMSFPFKDLKDIEHFYAHNCEFDFCVWNFIGRKHYGFPLLPLKKCIDSMAICARFNLPLGLDEAAKVLHLPQKKDTEGKKLMQRVTQPPFDATYDEERRFMKYGMQDTTVLVELVKALPVKKLSIPEQEAWELTVKINLRGVPVDVESCRRIRFVANKYIEEKGKDVDELTGGAVQRVTQTVRLREWVNSYGYNMPDFQKDTVHKWALRDDLEPEVKAVLELRAELGASSIAKYKRILQHQYFGFLYEILVYHKAGTGRWAGRGAQLHNFPRATIDEEKHGSVEEIIQAFQDMSILDMGDILSPVFAAKALLRAMLCAPEGKIFGVLDYKGIENRGLLWVVMDYDALEEIRRGLDQYISMAATLYEVAYEEINSKQRFMGKTLVLGCGYNLGGPGFMEYAAGYGIAISENESDSAVNTYREKYPKVRQFWYKVRDCAIAAIDYPGQKFTYKRCGFKVVHDKRGEAWLVLTLPSGRELYYYQPKVKEDKFGPVATHMGVNSTTHQWQRLKLIPGRITENIIQALGRDLLLFHKMLLEKEGIRVILSVHDEIITLLDEEHAEAQFARQKQIMTTLPPWAEGLPLEVEGGLLKRYKKI